MLIRKLSLRNFRNFKNCDIDFSCDPKKNFTIILGQNTFGKTTMVKSFIWCLYRLNLFEDKILLNSDVADNLKPGGNETSSVILELFHKGLSYKITTKEVYSMNSNRIVITSIKAYTSILKIEGGNAIPIPQLKVEEVIESILRPELKEYFFFDGETNSIDSVSSKKNLTDAVTNILGLDYIEMLRDYYDPSKAESVTSYLIRELNVDDNATLDNLKENYNQEIRKKERLEADNIKINNEIDRIKGQIKEQEEILDANKDVQKDQNEKKELDKIIEEDKRKKEDSFLRMIEAFNSSNSFLKVLFACSYSKNNLSSLLETSSFKSGSSYKGISEEAVEDLIREGKCLCGAEIKNGNEAYKHLLEAKQHMEPHDYGKYLSDFISAENSNVFIAKSSLDSIIDLAGKVNDCIESIDNNEKRLDTIKKRISGRTDVGEIQKTINDFYRQLGIQEQLLKTNNENTLPEIIQKIKIFENKISISKIKDQKNEFTQKCIDYAKSIYELANNKVQISRVRIRLSLQDEVEKIFKSMYHGNRVIKIDESFKAIPVVLKEGQDKKLDKSTGLGTVVNYSFVAGLMNLAKSSIINDDEMGDPDSINENYPLVMDAPFSNTDDEHIKNICHALPGFCDQIIMFVMKKDYKYASDSISDKIGKKYIIEKLSETEAIVKEEAL